jgi:hypothetical protein
MLICDAAFPSLFQRIEIQQLQITTLTPAATALMTIQGRSKRLKLELQKCRFLASTLPKKEISYIGLSRMLSEIVDVPPKDSLSSWSKLFNDDQYSRANPGEVPIIQLMDVAITQLVCTRICLYRIGTDRCSPGIHRTSIASSSSTSHSPDARSLSPNA